MSLRWHPMVINCKFQNGYFSVNGYDFPLNNYMYIISCSNWWRIYFMVCHFDFYTIFMLKQQLKWNIWLSYVKQHSSTWRLYSAIIFKTHALFVNHMYWSILLGNFSVLCNIQRSSLKFNSQLNQSRVFNSPVCWFLNIFSPCSHVLVTGMRFLSNMTSHKTLTGVDRLYVC